MVACVSDQPERLERCRAQQVAVLVPKYDGTEACPTVRSYTRLSNWQFCLLPVTIGEDGLIVWVDA